MMSCVSLRVFVCVMGLAPFFLHVSMVAKGANPVNTLMCVVYHLCEPENVAVEASGLDAFNQFAPALFPALPIP